MFTVPTTVDRDARCLHCVPLTPHRAEVWRPVLSTAFSPPRSGDELGAFSPLLTQDLWIQESAVSAASFFLTIRSEAAGTAAGERTGRGPRDERKKKRQPQTGRLYNIDPKWFVRYGGQTQNGRYYELAAFKQSHNADVTHTFTKCFRYWYQLTIARKCTCTWTHM